MQTFEQWLGDYFMNLREFKGKAITKDSFELWSDNLEFHDYMKFGTEYGLFMSKYTQNMLLETINK